MSNADTPKITAAQYDEQIIALKNAAATTIDSCLVSKFIAAADTRVRELFLQKITDGYVFGGIHCVNRVGIPENKHVVFDFDCAPGTICLVPPAFMVVVNVIDRYVVTIVDPYIPTSYTSRFHDCSCNTHSAARELDNYENRYDDPIGNLAGIISNVLGQPVTCAVVLNRCGNNNRCNEGFRKLRNFKDDPTAARAQELADWIGASSMQEKCMKAIIDTAGTVEYAIFLAAVIAAAAA
jgi:hypothetical protein